jgi:hypothetical protein
MRKSSNREEDAPLGVGWAQDAFVLPAAFSRRARGLPVWPRSATGSLARFRYWLGSNRTRKRIEHLVSHSFKSERFRVRNTEMEPGSFRATFPA